MLLYGEINVPRVDISVLQNAVPALLLWNRNQDSFAALFVR